MNYDLYFMQGSIELFRENVLLCVLSVQFLHLSASRDLLQCIDGLEGVLAMRVGLDL